MGCLKAPIRMSAGTPEIIHSYISDTEAERPESPLIGEDCYCKDTKKTYTCTSIGPVVWEQTGGSGGGGGPHTHPISDVTDLQTSLDGKAASGHTHSGMPSTVKITADLAASTSTTLGNATGLSFSVVNGTYYHFKFYITFRTAATTTGLKLSVTIPAVTRFAASASIPIASDGAGGQFQGWITASADAVTGTGVQAANTDYLAIVEGNILPSADGTLQLQFASEVASSAVTIRQGSCGVLTAF